jgi:N1221-like protein
MVSMLRDKTAKGYPIKKVRIRCSDNRTMIHVVLEQLLLVLWKTLLTCWGGVREHARVKKLARELAGLPPASENCEEFTY